MISPGDGAINRTAASNHNGGLICKNKRGHSPGIIKAVTAGQSHRRTSDGEAERHAAHDFYG
jgi:hypothetical protein